MKCHHISRWRVYILMAARVWRMHTWTTTAWCLKAQLLNNLQICSPALCIPNKLNPQENYPKRIDRSQWSMVPTPRQDRLILGCGEGFCTLTGRSTRPGRTRQSWIWVVALVLISSIMLDCLEPLCVPVNQANEPCFGPPQNKRFIVLFVGEIRGCVVSQVFLSQNSLFLFFL